MSTPEPIVFNSFRLLSDKLSGMGYVCDSLPTHPRFVQFTSLKGAVWATHQDFITYPFVSRAAGMIADNKDVSYAIVARQGANIPHSLLLPRDKNSLVKFLESYAPVIVKPAVSYGSHGLTLDITSARQLQDAVKTAEKYAKKVLVQQQFKGSELRFTILGGKAEHCLLRATPSVVGDGSFTVAELIFQENQARALLDNKILPYPQLDETIIPARFISDTAIPASGQIVEFSKSTLVAGGGSMHDVTHAVHASYKRIAEKIAAVINPEFLTIDMLIADYTSPATADNYVFLECNVSPSLRLYYDVRSGEDFDIVGRLTAMINKSISTDRAGLA